MAQLNKLSRGYKGHYVGVRFYARILISMVDKIFRKLHTFFHSEFGTFDKQFFHRFIIGTLTPI